MELDRSVALCCGQSGLLYWQSQAMVVQHSNVFLLLFPSLHLALLSSMLSYAALHLLSSLYPSRKVGYKPLSKDLVKWFWNHLAIAAVHKQKCHAFPLCDTVAGVGLWQCFHDIVCCPAWNCVALTNWFHHIIHSCHSFNCNDQSWGRFTCCWSLGLVPL